MPLPRSTSRTSQREREWEKQPLLEEATSDIDRDDDVDNAKAWLIALGVFFINFTIQGLGRIAGLLYVDFMEVFHITREVASQPYSVQQSARMLFGPMVGILGQHFGISFVKVSGCLLAALSSAACYFAKDMNTITVLWGGLYGIGTALAATVNVILVDQYFVRYKSTASGFVFCGTSSGAIILPLAMSFVIDKYGVAATFLLMGSIILYTVPVAYVLKAKPQTKSKPNLEQSSGTSSKFSSLPEVESSFGMSLKPGEPSKGYGATDSAPTNEIAGNVKFLETEDLKTSTPSESLEKKSNEKDVKVLGTIPPGYSKIVDKPEKEPEGRQSKSQKSRRKTKKSKKGQGETVAVTFKESRSSGGSTIESSIELATTKSVSKMTEPFKAIIHPKEDLSEERKGKSASTTEKDKSILNPLKSLKNITTQIQTVGEGAGFSDVIKNVKSSVESELFPQSTGQVVNKVKGLITTLVPEKSENIDTLDPEKENLESSSQQTRVVEQQIVPSEEYQDEKRVEKDSEIGDRETEISLERETRMPMEDRYSVNFNILRQNSDLVVDLLTNKIPLNDEEIMPSESEITQSNLESSDTEFLTRELIRLEQYFRLPVAKRDKYLAEIQEKLRKFNELLDADRNKFVNQEKMDFEGKQLVYKDIHSSTIEKPDCTIEITEYSFEIPVELYIPVKLQELNERSSTYVASHYSGDSGVFEVLTELRKLHDIFSKPPQSAKYSSESSSFQYKSFSGLSDEKRPVGEYPNTFRNHLRNSLEIHCNPLFLLVCLCRGLYTLAFVPVVMSVVDFAMDKSMKEENELYPIIALSLGDLIGRGCSGWITDKGFISDKNFMLIFLILQGASTAILPEVNAKVLIPALVVFGILQGALFMKHPVVLMKYLRTHEKYIGLGFMNFFSGILGLIIPFYIGYFRDEHGSYDMMYYINGGISGLLGVLWLFEPLLLRFVPKLREGGDFVPSSYY